MNTYTYTEKIRECPPIFGTILKGNFHHPNIFINFHGANSWVFRAVIWEVGDIFLSLWAYQEFQAVDPPISGLLLFEKIGKHRNGKTDDINYVIIYTWFYDLIRYAKDFSRFSRIVRILQVSIGAISKDRNGFFEPPISMEFPGSLNRWDRWYIITQLAVYTTYKPLINHLYATSMPLIYCLLGDYISPIPPTKGTFRNSCSPMARISLSWHPREACWVGRLRGETHSLRHDVQ